jgi:hypothetical protein
MFNKDGSVEMVKYHLLPSFLLASWQQQQKVIDAQKNDIAAIKRAHAEQIASLEQRLRDLEARMSRLASR